MNDHELVRKAIYDIFLKNGYDPEGALSQRDFEFICEEIEKHTRTLISVSTIKRLQKGDFSRIPQVATLNALAVYLGSRNWQDFKAGTRKAAIGPIETKPVTANPSGSKRIHSVSWKWPIAASVVLLMAVVFGFFDHHKGSVVIDGPVYFSARKATGNAIPNTVVFSYDLRNVKADSFFIQQSWDKCRRVKLDKKNGVLTDIYYEPGYHVAKLIANDSILKTVDVSIPTNAWMSYTSSFVGSKLPQYISTGKTLAGVNQSLNDTVLKNQHIATDENTLFVCSYFPGVLIGDADNFTCSARIRLTDARARQCPFLLFEVICQRQFMYFKSPNKGCASEADADFGDRWLRGKTADLSPLCFDLQQWANVDWQVKDKKVTISFNGQKVFETTYNRSCGKVAGIALISNGFYEASSVDLEGRDGKEISDSGFANTGN